jgi:hypothetical protein
MIFSILVTVFFFGLGLQIGILSVMRVLYSLGTCQPPLIPSDFAAKVSLDEDNEPPQLSRSTDRASDSSDLPLFTTGD